MISQYWIAVNPAPDRPASETFGLSIRAENALPSIPLCAKVYTIPKNTDAGEEKPLCNLTFRRGAARFLSKHDLPQNRSRVVTEDRLRSRGSTVYLRRLS
jgi:hypothetical protein